MLTLFFFFKSRLSFSGINHFKEESFRFISSSLSSFNFNAKQELNDAIT